MHSNPPSYSISVLDPLAKHMMSLPEMAGLTELGLAYPYTLSVIALTLSLRSLISVPLTLWQRKRNDRLTKIVMPEWQVWQKQIPASIWQRQNLSTAPTPEQERHVVRQIQKSLSQKWRHLISLYKCSPMKTTLTSLAIHVPLFVVVSLLLRQGAILPDTPLVQELVPWWSPNEEFAAQSAATRQVLMDKGLDPSLADRLTKIGGPTLADRDPTFIMPLTCGSINMINVELSTWTRLRRRAMEAAMGLAPGQNDVEEPPRARILSNMMRVGAIASIPIAAQMPSVLLVYWCTSSLVTLVQNVYFARIDANA